MDGLSGKLIHRAGWMGRNDLAGSQGDAISAVLTAVGYHFGLLLRWPALQGNEFGLTKYRHRAWNRLLCVHWTNGGPQNACVSTLNLAPNRHGATQGSDEFPPPRPRR